jgi:hypothetical protein
MTTARLSPSEQLTYATVRIECDTANGASTGTGFFFRFHEDGGNFVPAIVTNKHVIQGARRGKFHLHLGDQNGPLSPPQHISFEFDNFEQGWIPHPDPSVDLCIALIGPLLSAAAAEGRQFFFIGLSKDLVPTDDELSMLTALEDIVMIGYPNGIWDAVNNMPIIRRGITATHPNLNYEGRREFMIDAACFPGSSGSPVLLFNMGTYASRDGGAVIGTRIKLLGILYAGPQHTATGEIVIVNVPTTQKPMAVSTIPNNLGLVIKSSRLREFDPIVQQIVQAQS